VLLLQLIGLTIPKGPMTCLSTGLI